MAKRRAEPIGIQENAAERRVKCLELRKSGLSYREIGKRLGISNAQACRDIKRSLEELSAMEIQEAKILRQLEVERLNNLLESVWDKAISGDGWAFDRALRLSESLRKLNGLDAPIKNEITGAEGGALEIKIIYEDQDSPS